jgi:hypothetical protein
MARNAHWIKVNHQERMPPRMVAFDTESKSSHDSGVEVQEWRVGCAIRWRTDLASGDKHEARVFESPEAFWEWVSDYTRKGTRTVVWAHNLGYDVRISRMFEILPGLGFRLEWCNLDRNISSATWRSEHGTIVLADTWTWIPMPLAAIAGETGMVKYGMPHQHAPADTWARYCMQDCEILYRVVGTLMQFIMESHLGNWQPTGAGMAMATWRHKFLQHKILVHDDNSALLAERSAMHTGRAEAWRHGEIIGEKWTEVDFRNAYVTIASQIALPRKLHIRGSAISVEQFRRLRDTFAVLCRVTITQHSPVVPARINGRHVWPTGRFETWLWDNELGMALSEGAQVKIHEHITYIKDPVLAEWGQWVLHLLSPDNDTTSAIVRTHVKHCGRALIGRLAMRASHWEYLGTNIEGFTGITNAVMVDEQRTARLLHVGNDTLIETSRDEGDSSLPMITGYIMAEARCRLWRVMNVAGLENIAHVDTDSVLCNAAGLERLRDRYGDSFGMVFTLKGTYRRLEVLGPRTYFRDRQRVTSGVPLKAEPDGRGGYVAERWSSLASDLANGQGGTVTVRPATWHLKRADPRRDDLRGAAGRTAAYDASALSGVNGSTSSVAT